MSELHTCTSSPTMLCPACKYFETQARFDAKDGKWKVLVEGLDGPFVVEDRLLGKALAQVASRLDTDA